MADKDTTDIKIDIESLRKDIENVNSIQGRLDTAIDRLTDRQEEISDVYRELKKDIELIEKRLLIEIKSLKNDIGGRVGTLERYKWVIMGGAIVIGWILSKNLMPLLHMMNGV